MAGERPRRRITQPCLEYNGGLLHKEEVMLRKALYASLVDSKKPSPNKLSCGSHSVCETVGNNGSQDVTSVTCSGDKKSIKECNTFQECNNWNDTSESGQFITEKTIDSEMQKKIKEPSKLLNYVIKKKKEKRTNPKTLFRTVSSTKFAGRGEGSLSSQNGRAKKRRRQRGALAVFVAMNKSAGRKLSREHFLEADKDLSTSKRKRRRKRRGVKAQIFNEADTESEELPLKKSKSEENKAACRVVQAQRKFAKSHPMSPTRYSNSREVVASSPSITATLPEGPGQLAHSQCARSLEKRNMLSSTCTARAKTEDFLTFLCLRNHPVLPKELEKFNNPYLPMSPLSDEEENNNSLPPSPTHSQSSMSNSSNLSSTMHKSFSDSPVPSMDSPATGEGPSWESGVVRMYADGPKGLAGKGKESKKYDELLPSDDADDLREFTKSVTPPLSFRVSSRPTNCWVYKTGNKQLPRPIPKPFAVKPSITSVSMSKTALYPTDTKSRGDTGSPSSPLSHLSESANSPPPPPLLYIPAAAQRVTHLHEPPILQRFPSTSPSRELESDGGSELRRLSVDRNDGPPLLKRFPPVVLEHENSEKDFEAVKRSTDMPFLTQKGSSDFLPVLSRSPNGHELQAISSAALTTSGKSSSSLCDLTKISQMEKEVDGTTSRWRNREMPLLRRHSSATEGTVCFEELVKLPGSSRTIDSSSSPPQLQRVPAMKDADKHTRLSPLETADVDGVPGTSAGGLDTSSASHESSSRVFGTSGSRLDSSDGRLASSGSPLPASIGLLETSHRRHEVFHPENSASRLVGFDGLLSSNLSSHPPRLVRHPTSRPSFLETNLNVTSLQNDTVSPGIANQRQASPLAFPTNRRSAQSFQESHYSRSIPIAETLPVTARQSPVFASGKDSYKSTYVFATRQTFLQPENEPSPVKVSSLFLPGKSYVGLTPVHGSVHSMRHLQSISDLNQSDERRFSPRSIQNHYSGPRSHQSHVNLNNTNAGLSLANKHFNTSEGSTRIPSPRSDLLSRLSHEPLNGSCVSRVNDLSSESSSFRNRPMAIRSNIPHLVNTPECFPPAWSHLESPYSLPSVASRNTPPKPYTLSVNLPSPFSSDHTDVQSAESRSNSNTPVLEGYSLAQVRTSDQQQVRVIERTERYSGAAENYRNYDLPNAFQKANVPHSVRANNIFNESGCSDTSVSDRSVSRPYLNDQRTGDANMENSCPLLQRVEIPAKATFSKSNNLSRGTPSPVARQTELQAHTPSSKSPNFKGKKNSLITDSNKPCKSPKTKGTDIPGSKQKTAICPSLNKARDSPIFYPTEEEFKDPASYIKIIRHEAEKFGVCVIVPPESWKPEFQISDNLRFVSECQLIHRLQERWGPVEEEMACIRKHLDQQSIALEPMPQIGGLELDLPHFSRVVKQFGGLQKVIDSRKWARVAEILKVPRAAQDRIGKLQDIYCKYLLSYDLLSQDDKAELLRQVHLERERKVDSDQGTDTWTVKGRNFSLVPFQRLARNVQGHFFKNSPSANDVEKEFWKVVNDRETYVSVHRGTLDTNQEHSCFPTDKGDPYSKIGWNLNVLPHLPSSVLKHVGLLQDVTIPWLQFDMLFSVKPWQTHPLALYTVDYLHSGAEKIWYSIPVGERKNLASFYGHDVESAETSLVDKMVSPSSLSDGNVAVTRVVQKVGHFVIVFPEVYYSSVSCGYSVSEAVAFAPSDWLLLGCKRYKDLRESSWWSDFNYDGLLLGMAEELNDETQEVVQCLLAELKQIRDEEKLYMTRLLELGLVETVDKKHITSGSPSGKKGKKSLTSWTQADSSCVLYCEECDRVCYLSAVIGEDGPQVLCLKHAVQYITDNASPKGFKIMSRYDTDQLDELVNKVEDKLKNLEP